MSFWTPRPVAVDGESETTRFELDVTTSSCVGSAERQFFMGGVAMAAAISAAEAVTGRPLLWLSMQFLAQARAGSRVDVEVRTPVRGRSITQAQVSISELGQLLQTAMGALAEPRQGFEDAIFKTMPEVAPPLDCPLKAKDEAFDMDTNLMGQFERRVAFQDDETGREYMWIRHRGGEIPQAPLLALMADFLLGSHTLTHRGGSLDNTFRMHAPAATPWVLNVVELSALIGGAAHGTQFQFGEDGRLLSTSGQTGLMPRQ